MLINLWSLNVHPLLDPDWKFEDLRASEFLFDLLLKYKSKDYLGKCLGCWSLLLALYLDCYCLKISLIASRVPLSAYLNINFVTSLTYIFPLANLYQHRQRNLPFATGTKWNDRCLGTSDRSRNEFRSIPLRFSSQNGRGPLWNYLELPESSETSRVIHRNIMRYQKIQEVPVVHLSYLLPDLFGLLGAL